MEDPILPVVYVTKYALTQGILVYKNARLCVGVSDRMIQVGRMTMYHKPFWYTDLEEAKAHAEKVRLAKIKSVRKELEKLETMVVPVKDA